MTTSLPSTLQTGTEVPAISNTAWCVLYRIAAVATAIVIGFFLLDIALTAAPGGADNISEFTVVEWFGALQSNPFMAMRNLGIFNVITLLLYIPLYAALYGVHRHVNAVFAGTAAVMAFVGIAIYVTNNPALALLHLSGQYVEAASDSERTLLIGAAHGLLAQGEDFSPGAYVGFLMPSLAAIIMAWVMLTSGLFRRVTGWLLLVGTTLVLIYTTLVTFVPSLFDLLLALAAVGGLMAVAGYATVITRLWHLGGITSAHKIVNGENEFGV